MIKVLPSILTDDTEVFLERLNILIPFADLIHVDVMDGNFVPSKSITVHGIKDLLNNSQYEGKLELHLMVYEPVRYIENIKDIKGISSVVLHVESMENPRDTIDLFHRRNIKVGITQSILTDDLKKLYGLKFDYFLVLSEEEPGYSGTPFSVEAIKQIEQIRKSYPDILIEVDGGINEITGTNCLKHGANALIANSFMFKNNDPKKQFEILTKLDVNE